VRRVTGSGGSAKSVTIRAKGTASGGVWPLMSLYVNGQYRTQWTVSSSSYADYSATTTLTGNDQIEVVYSNDSGSRNLYVDYVVVDGRTVQAEQGAAVIDKGSADAAFDGLEVIAGQQGIYENGALRFVVGTQAYAACYDANGNMTWRLLDGAAYEQLWDAENRLVQVKKGSTVQATFVYDGNGARVKATVGSVTTAYVGSHFEWAGSTSTTKRYYYAGGERVAMRWGSSTVYWLLGDHLGSTAMTVASSGTWVAEVRYKAWGETRYSSGTTPTSYRFTGQRLEPSLGLYLMGARWYDPLIDRWVSPDSVLPDPANPQSLNRFSYALENPCRYRDPSGHSCVDALEGYPAEQYDCMSPEGEFLVFYLNGLGGSPDYLRALGEGEYGAILYVLGLLAGEENVIHVPLFTDPFRRGFSQLDMIAEALGFGADQTRFAAQFIKQYLGEHPLEAGQRLVLVGSSAGGTVAVETLDMLEEAGIFVDHLIMRGSFVHELSIDNVGRVDYIAADPPLSDQYYSVDINPFDSISVNEHKVYGLSGHNPNAGQMLRIAGLIVDLMIEAQPR